MNAVFDTQTNGVDFYNVTSEFITETTVLRILEQDDPDLNMPTRVIIVLPVKPLLDETFGDGLEALQALNYHNIYNCYIVAPSFPTEPWIGNNVNNTGRRYESFILELKDWCLDNVFAPRFSGEEYWGISFSKGGASLVSLMLRNTVLFDRVAVWDAPTQQVYDISDGYDMDEAYGTEANYLANYQSHAIASIVNVDHLTGSPKIWISGDIVATNYNIQVRNTANILFGRGVKLGWLVGNPRAHTWTSGWLVNALTWLNDPVAAIDLRLHVWLQFPDTGVANNVVNKGYNGVVTAATLQAGMSFDTVPNIGDILDQPATNGLLYSSNFLSVDGTDKSIFARVKFNSLGSAYQSIVDKEDSGTNNYALLITNTSKMDYHACNGKDLTDTGDIDLVIDEWLNLCITWNATIKKVRFYINGIFNSEIIDLGVVEEASTGLPLNIGKARNNTIFPFDGQWSEVRIYDAVLTDTEVANLKISTPNTEFAGGGLAGGTIGFRKLKKNLLWWV